MGPLDVEMEWRRESGKWISRSRNSTPMRSANLYKSRAASWSWSGNLPPWPWVRTVKMIGREVAPRRTETWCATYSGEGEAPGFCGSSRRSTLSSTASEPTVTSSIEPAAAAISGHVMETKKDCCFALIASRGRLRPVIVARNLLRSFEAVASAFALVL